ncbi:MAG: class I SAM-dependent methyltransferase [Candidatus Rokubacteria bacterium]|nr:class I SAM-dependent methyltransferase [Candidatus Rokubacteria bacterium]
MPSLWGMPSADLQAFEMEVYLRVLKRGDRILLVGFGTGRDLIALLELGYQVDGLELVPESAATARQRVEERGLTTRIVCGTVDALPLSATYDVVIFSYGCYSCIPEAATRIHALRICRDRLAPRGRIVVNYIPDRTRPHPVLVRTARLVAWLTRSDWRVEDGDYFVRGSWGERIQYQHHFAGAEIEAEARAAGLRVVHHRRSPETTVVLAV